MTDLMQQAREWQSSAERTSDGRLDALLLAVRKYGAASSTLGGSPLSKPDYYDAQTRRDLAWAEIDAIAESLVEDIKNIHAMRAAPEGYVLVPAEPTEAMHAAAVKTIRRCTGNDDFPPRVWRAMVAARPQGVKDAP